MTEHLTAWREYVAMVNRMNATERREEFNANNLNYAPMMHGFYMGFTAGRIAGPGKRADWELAGEA